MEREGNKSLLESLPNLPELSDEYIDECISRNDYVGIFFDHYKYAACLASVCAFIVPDSSAIKALPSTSYAILTGLLNRCVRLMLANVALSHEGKFGESTAILDRCIAESAIKLSWLCYSTDDDRFKRFLADGLRTDLELQNEIFKNIKKRGGAKINIEERMLNSIGRVIEASCLSREEILQIKKMSNLASIIESIGKDRLMYTVIGRMGSHHVHGTWASLIFHYLDEPAKGEFVPRAAPCPPHVNQYVFIPLIVIEAAQRFLMCVSEDCWEREYLFEALNAAADEIGDLNKKIIGTDFDEARIE